MKQIPPQSEILRSRVRRRFHCENSLFCPPNFGCPHQNHQSSFLPMEVQKGHSTWYWSSLEALSHEARISRRCQAESSCGNSHGTNLSNTYLVASTPMGQPFWCFGAILNSYKALCSLFSPKNAPVGPCQLNCLRVPAVLTAVVKTKTCKKSVQKHVITTRLHTS